MKRGSWLRLCILLATCMTADAATNPMPVQVQGIALIIGNGDYDGNGRYDDNAGVPGVQAPDLRNTCEDAKRIEKSLISAHYAVTRLCDLDEQHFVEAVNNFGVAVQKSPKAPSFFYYSGHGVQVDGINYLLPTKFHLNPNVADMTVMGRQNALHAIAVGVDTLIAQIGTRMNTINVIALDACRDNPVAKGLRNTKGIEDGRGLVYVSPNPGMLVAFATHAGTEATTGTGAVSPYADALSAAITRGGEQVLDMFMSVAFKVLADTANTQSPDFMAAGMYNTCFNCADASMGDDSKLAAANPAVLSKIPAPTMLASLKGLEADTGELAPGRPKGLRLDIFWCQKNDVGDNGRYSRALNTGRLLAAISVAHTPLADGSILGQVRVRPISPATNARDGYRIKDNLIRYDPGEEKLAQAVLFAGKTGFRLSLGTMGTPGYLSAFFCGK
jgi:hypothetical protein